MDQEKLQIALARRPAGPSSGVSELVWLLLLTGCQISTEGRWRAPFMVRLPERRGFAVRREGWPFPCEFV